MTPNRREFIEHVGAAAMLSALPLSVAPTVRSLEERSVPAQDWDLTWTARLKGKKHKACFDCTEIESGYGLWRASIWANQYEASGAKPAELHTVLILRHNAVALALHQDFWDTYGVGKAESVTHPISLQSTDRNPALLTAVRGEVPAAYDTFALPKFLARGGTALGCDLALLKHVRAVQSKDGVSLEEARKRVLAAVVPGVIMQPSGVLAAVRAQEEGCVYVKAS